MAVVEHAACGNVCTVEPFRNATEIEFGLGGVEFHAQQIGVIVRIGGEVRRPRGRRRCAVQALQETGRCSTARILARAHRREVGAAGIATHEKVAARGVVQHDAGTVRTRSAVVAHPNKARQVLVDPEHECIAASVVRVAGAAARVQRQQVRAGRTSANEHITIARQAHIVVVVRTVAAHHGCLDRGAGRVDLQHEHVDIALRLLVEAATAEIRSTQKREVRTARLSGDVQISIRALFHGVRIVITTTADVRLPYTCADPADRSGFEVLAHDHLQVAVGRYVERTYCDVVRRAHHAGHNVDRSVGRVHPYGVSVVVAGAVRVDPSSPAHGDRIDHQCLRLVIDAKLKSQDVTCAHCVPSIHFAFAAVDHLVHHWSRIGHLAQARRHHQLTLCAYAQPFNALEFNGNIPGIAAGFADDVVFERAVSSRVVARVDVGVNVGVPHLVVATNVEGLHAANEVVHRLFVSFAAFDPHF